MGCLCSTPAAGSRARDGAAPPTKPKVKSNPDVERLVLIGTMCLFDQLLTLVGGCQGPGESGKSTIFKQMKLIESREMGTGGYSVAEKQGYVQIVYDNIVSQMRVLLRVAQETNAELGTPAAKEAAARVREGLIDGSSPEMGQYCKTLWADPVLRNVYAQRDLIFNLNDGAG